MPRGGLGGAVPRSAAGSKSLPEGSDLGPIAAQIHAAPATAAILAGVVEIEYALGILALADGGVIRRGQRIASYTDFAIFRCPSTDG